MNGTVSTSKSISDKLTPVLFTVQDMGSRAEGPLPKARAWPRGWQRRCIVNRAFVPRDSRMRAYSVGTSTWPRSQPWRDFCPHLMFLRPSGRHGIDA